MGQDLRHAWAAIRSNPLLALAAALTLTLGMGLNAGVFTVVDGLLFRARAKGTGEFRAPVAQLSWRNCGAGGALVHLDAGLPDAGG